MVRFLVDRRMSDGREFEIDERLTLALAGKGYFASALMESVLQAMAVDRRFACSLRSLDFVSAPPPLIGMPKLKIVLENDGEQSFQVCSNHEDLECECAAKGYLAPRSIYAQTVPIRIEEVIRRCGSPRSGQGLSTVESIWGEQKEAVGRLYGLPRELHPVCIFHPAQFELVSAVRASEVPESPGCVDRNGAMSNPTRITIDELFFYPIATAPAWVHARQQRNATYDVAVLDGLGRCISKAVGLRISEPNYRQEQTIRFGIFEPEWHEVRSRGSRDQGSDTWLVLADDSGLGERLKDALESRRQSVFLAHSSNSTASADAAYEAVDFAELFRIPDTSPNRIVHMWGLNQSGASDTPGTPLWSAIRLVQLLPQHCRNRIPTVYFVTRGAQRIGDDSAIAVGQSLLWGFVATLRLEHPELRARVIDVDPAASDGHSLADELLSGDDEPRIALRTDRRLALRLRPARHAPARLVDVERKSSSGPVLRSDRTYLVTGGLGGLGLLIARRLLEFGARHLVLVGRRPPAPAAERYISEHLTRSDTTIRIANVDVAHRVAVQSLLGSLKHRMPPLDGVFHCAGVVDNRAISNLDARHVSEVLAAKVHGTLHLHELTDDLRYFVMFSSLVGLIGNHGQASYAAANAFMDALAHFRRCNGLVATSIDWAMWDDIGMAKGHHSALGTALSVEDALGVFETALGGFGPQIVVLPGSRAVADLPPGVGAAFKSLLSSSQLRNEARDAHLRRAAKVSSRSALYTTVVTLLGKRYVSESDRLGDLGLDSLGLLRFRSQLAQETGILVPHTAINERSTVADVLIVLTDSGSTGHETRPGHGIRWIRTEGLNPPLVFLHPIGGNANCYEPVAAALPYRSAAIGMTSLQKTHGAPPTIEGLAKTYVGLLRQADCLPPYFLCGWSFGGLLAFQIAHELLAEGRATPLVILIDSYIPPGDARADPALQRYLWGADDGILQESDTECVRDRRALRRFLRSITAGHLLSSPNTMTGTAEIDALVRMTRTLDELGVIREAVAKGLLGAILPADAERLYSVFQANAQAVERYRPQYYRGKILAIQSSLAPEALSGQWGKLASNATVSYLAMDHYGFMKEPVRDRLIDLLRDHCAAVAAESTSPPLN